MSWFPRPHFDPIPHRGPRFLQIMVVLTALTMTVVGLLESLAAKHAEEAAVRTQERSVSTMAAFRRAQQQAQVALETFALAQELHVRASSLQQRLLVTGSAPRRQAVALARDRWRKTAADLDRLSGIKRGAWESPEQDAEFPTRYLQRTWRGRDYEFALQDAAVEDFLLWKRVVNYYAAILMVLSVALYLFGLALATRTHEAKGFFKRVAMWLLSIGIVAAVIVSAQFGNAAWGQHVDRSGEPCLLSAEERHDLGLGEDGGMAPAGVPDADRHAVEGQAVTRAAACYAAGREAYVLQKYSIAINLLKQAVAARPHFGFAFLTRANAYYESGSLSLRGPTSVSDVGALRLAIDDFNQARRFLQEDSGELADIGDAYLQLALLGAPSTISSDPWWLALSRDPQRLRSWRLNTAIRLTIDAIRLDPDDATSRYNLGVALLARDGAVTPATREAFSEAAKRTRGLNDSAIWSAFTDLEKIARAEAGQKANVQQTKEYALQQVAGQKPSIGAAQSGPPAKATIVILPVGLRWTACLHGYDPDRDTLVAAWFYGPLDADSRGSKPGTVLADISGPVRPTRQGTCEHSGTSYSKMLIFAPSTPEPRCVQGGWYRVELYLNGRLIGQGLETADRDFPELAKTMALDQEEGMCQPVAWTRYQSSVIGFVDGAIAPDRTKGVFTYRFQHLLTRDDDWNATSSFYLEHALGDLRDLIPSPVPASRACTTFQFQSLARPHDPWHRYAWYRYGRDGCVYARTDLFDTGTVVVDLVFGPARYFNEREPYDLLESIWIREPSMLPAVSIAAPVQDVSVSSPARLVVNTRAALSAPAAASSVDPMLGTRSRAGLHVAVDGREFMPGAADWKQVKPGRYEYRLPTLAPGTHTVRVYWADSATHKPRGPAQSVDFMLTP